MTIQIAGYHRINGDKRPQHARVSFNLTAEEAAQFPKSLGLKDTKGRTYSTTINFMKNGVNGDKNEAGIKRIHKLFAAGAAFEVPEFTANAYRCKDEFLAAIA